MQIIYDSVYNFQISQQNLITKTKYVNSDLQFVGWVRLACKN